MAFSTRKLLLSSVLSVLLLFIISATKAQTNALSFDGVNDQMVVGTDTALNLNTQITIESWIKPDLTNTRNVQSVISKSSISQNTGYIFPRTDDNWNKLVFYINFNALGWRKLEVPYTAYKSSWTHVAATYDGAFMRIYINGSPAGELAVTGTITVNTNPLTVGYHNGFEGTSSEYFAGSIDEIRIWRRALVQCEIQNNLTCEVAAGGQTGLVSYFKLNQGSAGLLNSLLTSVTNSIAGRANATLNNFGLLGLTSNWIEGIATGTCSVFTPPVTSASSDKLSYLNTETIQFNATGGVSYSWTGPNGFTSTLASPTRSASGNAGTYTVAITTANGCVVKQNVTIQVSTRTGRGLHFDGINDVVTIADNPSLNTGTGLTIEAWIRPTDRNTPIQTVVNKSSFATQGYVFPRTDDGWRSISFYVHLEGQGWKIARAPYPLVNGQPQINTWHHVAATYDGFKLRIYVNGVLSATEEFVGQLSRNTNPISIGNQSGYTEFYQGNLDEVRIWNRALDLCEITNNMNCELPMPQTGLQVYYQFDQGLESVNNTAITQVTDASGNNNNGSLTNFTLLSNTSNFTAGKLTNDNTCAPFTAPTITAAANGSVLEVGSTIQLTANTDGASSYSWTGPNNFTSNQQNPTLTNAQIVNGGTYVVTAEVNGCNPLASVKVVIANKGGSITLDGVDDMLTHPSNDAFKIQNQITLESWVYPTDGQRNIQSVMGNSSRAHNYGYIFPRTDDGWKSVIFYLHINGEWKKLTAPEFNGLNQWHHVAATYDGFNMRIYVDGVLKATQEATGTITTIPPADLNTTINPNLFVIGNQPGFTEFYRGKLEEAKVWNRALNQCEIINNMNCELQPSQSGLVAYYKFNQGWANVANAETSVIDAGGNNRHLSLVNVAQDGTASNWSDFKVNGTCSTYAEPPVTAQANGSVFGIGSTIRLFANGGTAYEWTGPSSFESNSPSPIVYNAQSVNTGIYTVGVPFVNCKIYKSVRLTVTPLPAIQASGNTTICPSSKVTLSIASVGTAYQWYLNDEPITGANSSTYQAGATGAYSVGVTVDGNVQISAPISVTVVDNVPPSPNVVSLPTLNLSAPVTITNYPTASDNCRGTVTATTNSPLTFTQSGTYTIVWTYNDGNGNTATQTQQVVVVRNDVTSPVLNNLPSNVTVNCSAVPAVPVVTATDDVDGTVSVTFTESSTRSADIYNAAYYNYTITRTWSATDGSNNTSTVSRTITVVDNQAPVFGTINNINIAAANNAAGANVTYNVSAIDACGSPVTYTYNILSGSFFQIGVTTVQVTARDVIGNTANTSFTVSVFDNQAPAITAPANITVNTDAGSAFATNVNLGNATVSDNSASGVSITNNAPAQFPIGNTTVTWTATDAAGNATTATQVVTVKDVEPPVLVVPSSVTTVTNNSQAYATNVALGNASATDNSGFANISNDAPGQFPIGSTTVTWTAIDAAGNKTTATQQVIVQDKEAPVLIAPSNKIVSTNTGANFATGVDLGNASGSDNSGMAVQITNNAPSVYQLGQNQVLWTITDAFGNTASAIQIITVKDTEKPLISGVANIVVDAPSGSNTAIVSSLGTPSATDNVQVVSLTNNSSSTIYPIGTTTIVWTAIDAAGNENTTVQLVIVRDKTAPVLSEVPANTTVTCGSIPAVATVTASDNYDQNISVSFTESSTKGTDPTQASFYNYTITRTWTATDAGLNQVSASQGITVVDNQAPVINQPVNIEANSASGICGATVNFTVTASDLCGSPITYTYSKASGTVFPVGVTTVEVTATDASGNSSSSSFTVTVRDNQAPVITAPANIDVVFGAAINLGNATATDNCGVISITNNAPSSFPIGITVVTWTATDAAGNTSKVNQSVTVRDGIAPVLSGVPANVTVSCGSIPAVANVTASDNYDPSVTVIFTETTTKGSNPAQASFYNYVITRTWSARDASGNQVSASQAITVVDTQAPQITQPINIATNSAAGTCGAIVNYTVTATDNCGSPITYTYSKASGTVFSVGITTVTVTATDASGNSSSRSFTVTVTDNQIPSITAPANISVTFGTAVNLGTPIASDNCGVPTVTNNAPTTFPLGVTIVTWTAVDAAGNRNTATQTVTVVALTNCSSSITAIPENNTYTGGIPTNIYLGYGPQRVTLRVNATGGTSYTYNWTVVSGNGSLSSTTSSQPVFAPTQAGTYTFEVRVRTQAGCVSISRVTICVKDIRVKGGDDDDDDDDCDHKSHSSKDCKHKDHKYHSDCDHKSHSSKDCKNKSSKYSRDKYDKYDDDDDDDDCDHKSHSSKDCKHKDHKYHADCDHKSHNSKDCKNKSYKHDHDDDDDDEDDDSPKVYLCHVPPGNSNNPQTLRISINAVESHLRNHPGDKLGSCDQQGCTETIVVSTNPNVSTATATTEESASPVVKKLVPQISSESDLEIKVMGNPSRTFFTIKMESKYELPVQVRVFDINGRPLESKANQLPNSTIQIGHNLGSGTYYAEFQQGTRRKVIQLIKVR